jgi:hypothetical protein
LLYRVETGSAVELPTLLGRSFRRNAVAHDYNTKIDPTLEFYGGKVQNAMYAIPMAAHVLGGLSIITCAMTSAGHEGIRPVKTQGVFELSYI